MFEVLRKIIKLGTITKKYDQVYFSENFRGKLECFLAEKCLNCKKCISVCPTGALEASNVDLTKQFSDMIIAQRAVEANSRVFSTQNQVLQTLMYIGQ